VARSSNHSALPIAWAPISSRPRARNPHRVVKRRIDVTQNPVVGNPHLVDTEFGLAAHGTDGVVERADLELVVLDDEAGDPAVAAGLLLGCRPREHLDEVGVGRVRDPLFRAVEHLLGQAAVRLVAEPRVRERLAQFRGDRRDLLLDERIEVPEDETGLLGRVERDPEIGL
jgi:hypothetical protein